MVWVHSQTPSILIDFCSLEQEINKNVRLVKKKFFMVKVLTNIYNFKDGSIYLEFTVLICQWLSSWYE